MANYVRSGYHFGRAVHVDHMSAYEWIEKYVPGGHQSPLGAYVDAAYTNEFGLTLTVRAL